MNTYSSILKRLAVLLLSTVAALGQVLEWQEYAPPDRSFRIQSPAGDVVELSSEIGDRHFALTDTGSKGYFFRDLNGKSSGFSLFVYSAKLSGISELRKAKRWKDYVMLMHIGDDD